MRMQAKQFAVAAAMAVLPVLPVETARAAEYDIDLSHSFIQFRAQHLGVSWLLGSV